MKYVIISLLVLVAYKAFEVHQIKQDINKEININKCIGQSEEPRQTAMILCNIAVTFGRSFK